VLLDQGVLCGRQVTVPIGPTLAVVFQTLVALLDGVALQVVFTEVLVAVVKACLHAVELGRLQRHGPARQRRCTLFAHGAQLREHAIEFAADLVGGDRTTQRGLPARELGGVAWQGGAAVPSPKIFQVLAHHWGLGFAEIDIAIGPPIRSRGALVVTQAQAAASRERGHQHQGQDHAPARRDNR